MRCRISSDLAATPLAAQSADARLLEACPANVSADHLKPMAQRARKESRTSVAHKTGQQRTINQARPKDRIYRMGDGRLSAPSVGDVSVVNNQAWALCVASRPSRNTQPGLGQGLQSGRDWPLTCAR
jgi:hypothetical protein